MRSYSGVSTRRCFPFFSSSFFALCVYRSHPSPPVKLKYGLAFKKAPDTNPTCVCQTNSPPMDLVNSLLTRLDSSIPLLHFTLMTALVFFSLTLPLKPQGCCAISLLRNVFLILLVDFHQKNNSGVFTDCRFSFFLSVCFLSQSLLFVNLKLKQRVFTSPCPWLTLAAVSPVGPASWLPRGPRRA